MSRTNSYHCYAFAIKLPLSFANNHGAYTVLKAIFLLPLVAISNHSYASSFSCGGTQVTVSDATSDKEPYFTVTLKNKIINKAHKFEIQKDFIHIRCEETSTGKPVVFINHFCGGSGCADLGNYGVIEASSGAVLLEPNQPFKGNQEKAKEVMGKELKKFTCTKESGEICIHSDIILG